MILNVNKFQKDGKIKSRLGYIYSNPESMVNNDKMFGFPDYSLFFDDDKAFTRIPTSIIGKKVIAEVDEVPNPSNPLTSRKTIVSIEYEGQFISLQ